jgi:hypothetical protein
VSRTDPFWQSHITRAGIVGAIGLAVTMLVGWGSGVSSRLSELEHQRAADAEWRKAVCEKLDSIASDVRTLKR